MNVPSTDTGLLCLKNTLFPSSTEKGEVWRHLHTWLAVALALRSIIALGGDFVIHPDEIMQYLEPAHRAVFGSGIVFWEFQYGGRSWLVPGFVAAILWILDAVGLGRPTVYVYVVKIVFCLVSLAIPWGAYHFCKRAFGEASARTALVLTCMWPYLVVMAHKPYTEFLSTALVFLALGLACRPNGKTIVAAAIIGGTLALAGAIRMQYILVAALVWAVALFAAKNKKWALSSIAAVFAIVIFVAILETVTWGSPFLSYKQNFIVNSVLEDQRTPQAWHFYLSRLLYATAGLVLVAAYAFIRNPKRLSLPLALALVVLLTHMAFGHKEFRFVFMLMPLLLIAASDQLAKWSMRLPIVFSVRGAFEYSLVFFIVVVGNFIDERWLHVAHSLERGDSSYLFNQVNVFDAYLELSRLEDVKGVLHVGELYFNTPGYFYLHHDVPLYDVSTFRKAMETTDRPQDLFSHIVTVGGVLDLPDMITLGGEGEKYLYGFIDDVGEVRQWKSNTPNIINNEATIMLREAVGYEVPLPFEFAD